MIKLSELSTRAPEGITKTEAKEKMESITSEIGELVEAMHAGRTHSLLVVFQGMDSSGRMGQLKTYLVDVLNLMSIHTVSKNQVMKNLLMISYGECINKLRKKEKLKSSFVRIMKMF